MRSRRIADGCVGYVVVLEARLPVPVWEHRRGLVPMRQPIGPATKSYLPEVHEAEARGTGRGKRGDMIRGGR